MVIASHVVSKESLLVTSFCRYSMFSSGRFIAWAFTRESIIYPKLILYMV